MIFLQTGPRMGLRPYGQGGEHASCLPRPVAAPCKYQTCLGLAVEAGGPPRHASVLSDPAPVSRVRTMSTMTHATINREGQAQAIRRRIGCEARVVYIIRSVSDPAAVTALLDRLLHHAHVLKCEPRSWRTKVHTDLRAEELAK